MFKSKAEKSIHRSVPPEIFTRKDSTEIKSAIDNKTEEKLDKIFSEVSNLIKESHPYIDQHKSITLVNEKNSKVLSLAIENNGFYGKPKNEFISKLENIQGKRKANDEKILEIEKSNEEIVDYLSPTNMNRVRDSLIDGKLNACRTKNPNKLLTENAKEEIVKQVTVQLAEIAKDKLQAILYNNQTLNVLFENENTYAFEIKELEVNLSLKKYLGVINNNSFFELGSDDLTNEGRIAITRDVNIFLDSLFNKIPDIIAVRANDSIKYEITLNISLDGFADSKSFDGVTLQKSKELNIDLSQRRSDNIMYLISELCTNKTRQIFIMNVSFTQPTKSSIGHGEELPDPNGVYEPDGKDDSNRRITILQCTFSIKQK